jgi:hypothetical protein
MSPITRFGPSSVLPRPPRPCRCLIRDRQCRRREPSPTWASNRPFARASYEATRPPERRIKADVPTSEEAAARKFLEAPVPTKCRDSTAKHSGEFRSTSKRRRRRGFPRGTSESGVATIENLANFNRVSRHSRKGTSPAFYI